MKKFFVLFLFPLVFFYGCVVGKTYLNQDIAYKLYCQGLLYENEGKSKEAISCYQRAFTSDPSSAEILRKLGTTYLKVGSLKKAKKFLFLALEKEPGNKKALRGLAILYLVQKKANLAIEQYEKLIRLFPEDLSSYLILADLYARKKNLPKALQFYRKSTTFFPENGLLHYNYGLLLEQSNQEDAAEKELEKAIELQPNFVRARLALAIIYEKRKKYFRAIAQYQKVLNLDKTNPLIYQQLARLYLEMNEREEAKKVLEEALEAGIEDWQICCSLAFIYYQEENFDSAKLLLTKALSRENNSTVHFYLALILDKEKQREGAVNHLKQAIKLMPDDYPALNYLGYLYAEEGINLKEAEKLVKRAIRLEPDNGAYLDSLGWVYFKMGKTEKARIFLEKAADLEKDPEIYEHLGEVYCKKKLYLDALAAFARSLELKPSEKIRKKLDAVYKLIKSEH